MIEEGIDEKFSYFYWVDVLETARKKSKWDLSYLTLISKYWWTLSIDTHSESIKCVMIC